MKKNKKLIIIISIIIPFVVTTFIFFRSISDTNNNDNTLENNAKDVLKRIEDNGKYIIYITKDNRICDECEPANRIVKYLSDNYNLNFIYYDKDNINKKDYNYLDEKLEIDIQSNIVDDLGIILIENGKTIATHNTIYFEYELRDFLEENNFLTKEEANEEVFIENTEEFKKIYNEDQYNLILLYTYNTANYDFRTNVATFRRKYNLKYYNIYSGVGDSMYALSTLTKGMKEEEPEPALILVKNGKVIDYVKENNAVIIKEFLDRNNLIK